MMSSYVQYCSQSLCPSLCVWWVVNNPTKINRPLFSKEIISRLIALFVGTK